MKTYLVYAEYVIRAGSEEAAKKIAEDAVERGVAHDPEGKTIESTYVTTAEELELPGEDV